MTAVVYRRAQASDAEIIARFQIAMAWETEQLELDSGICIRGVSAVFDNPSLGQYYVGERDGLVVCSTLITYEWSDWRNGLVWWIQSVYVIPESRKQGIYAGLYSFVRALAHADSQVRGIRLYVDRNNVGAQHVYTRLGMNGDHYQVFEWMKS
jgi:ribosomal protein S18 acetylase RimI-like enzyme